MFNEPDHTMGPRTTADSNAEGRMVVDAKGGHGRRHKSAKADRSKKRKALRKTVQKYY